jgi:hypothetical protein
LVCIKNKLEFAEEMDLHSIDLGRTVFPPITIVFFSLSNSDEFVAFCSASIYGSQYWPRTLLQVKHLTGMIILL